MSNEDSNKIINFMTKGTGVLALECGRIILLHFWALLKSNCVNNEQKGATQNVMPWSPGAIVHRVQIYIFIDLLFYFEENAESQGFDKHCKFHDTEDIQGSFC